jgi:hypothetical protein
MFVAQRDQTAQLSYYMKGKTKERTVKVEVFHNTNAMIDFE